MIIDLPYPISANRYWRISGNRIHRSEAANAYKTQCAWIAKAAGVRLREDDLGIVIQLHPRTTKGGEESGTRLDLDNALKVVIDALNGVAYADDKQIREIMASIGAPRQGGGLSISIFSASGEK